MEIRDLRLVVTLADELHFGRAAERLHIGQPALSQQLRRLERRLDVRLFERSTHHVRLTTAGITFVHLARPILSSLGGLEERMRQHSPDLQLRIGVVNPTYDLSIALVSGLRSRLDRLQVTERTVLNLRTAADLLRRDELDLYVGVWAPVEDLEAMPLRSDRFGLYLPADHPLASHGVVSLRAAAELELVVDPNDEAPEFLSLVDRMFHRAGVRLRRAAGVSSSVDAAVLAVARGGPPVVGPLTSVVPPGVSWIGFTEPWAHDTLHLVRRAGPPSPAVRDALAAVEAVSASEDWRVIT